MLGEKQKRMLEFYPTYPNLRRKLNSWYINLAVKMKILSWILSIFELQKFFWNKLF